MFKKTIYLCFLLLIPQFGFAASKNVGKIKFLNVHFKGNEKLIHIVQSEAGKRFEPRLVKLDKILLTNYYKKNGFLNVAVTDSIAMDRRRDMVRIFYRINEGQRFYYGGVRFKGNYDLPTRQLVKTFDAIKLYTPFDEEKISLAAKQVENIYYNFGKPFIEMNVSYLYDQDSLIVVYINLKENQTVYIQQIRYQGLKHIKRHVIKRELEFKKGEMYNRQKLDESQKNLYGTGLFKYVRFEIEPLPDTPGKVRLNILFEEKKARWLGVRFGVAHEQEVYYGNKLELTLQGGHRNLFGSGRSLSLHITPSFIYDTGDRKMHNPDNKISLQLVQPWAFNSPTPISFQMLYEQFRPLNSGHFDLWHINLDAQRKIKKINEYSASISAKRVNLLSNQAVDSTLASKVQINKSQVYALTLYYKRDNRQNVFNPRNSAYTDVSLAYSYASGLDEQHKRIANNYISIIAAWQRYQPWNPQILNFRRWHLTLATRIKAGAIVEPWGRKTIPISDRFFAGGATTVRGYGEQLLGPAEHVDQNGKITQAAGGKMLYLMNAEVRMPVFWLFMLEYFVDGGYVWREINDFRFTDIKFSTGLGLALLTPLGPVRVDYGYKLMPTALDPTRGSFHIGIYFAF